MESESPYSPTEMSKREEEGDCRVEVRYRGETQRWNGEDSTEEHIADKTRATVHQTYTPNSQNCLNNTKNYPRNSTDTLPQHPQQPPMIPL